MTKQEIKDLVAAKIAGQGNQIDLGNALPTIINAIVDLIPEDIQIPIATPTKLGGVKVGNNLLVTEDGILSVNNQSRTLTLTAPPEEDDTLETLAEKGLTETEIDKILNGEYSFIRYKVRSNDSCFPITLIRDERTIGNVVWAFAFYNISYDYVEDIKIDSIQGWSLYYEDGELTVSEA